MTQTNLPEFSIAILAGGRSRRMKGIDKLALEIEGQPLLARVLARLAPVREKAAETFLVAKERERFGNTGIPVVLDLRETGGALVGITSALAAAKTDYVFALAGDMPFASPEIAELLLSECGGNDVTIPVTGEMYEPLFAVYSKSCLATFEKGLDGGAKKIVEMFGTLRVNRIPESAWRPLDTEGNAFININTPEDLEKL